MVNEQIVNWIKENQAKGFDLESLQSQLMQSGWSQSDISEAIDFVSNTSPAASAPTEELRLKPNPKRKSFKRRYFIPLIFASIAVVSTIFYILLP